MKESTLRTIEDARTVASWLEKGTSIKDTHDRQVMAHSVERLVQELFQACHREEVWRKALGTACHELEEDRT